MSEPKEMSSAEKSAASKLFDLRLMIGGLFVVYGIILIIAGFFDSEAEITKAVGIHMNLWLGLGMLVLGGLFLIWRALSPSSGRAEPNPTDKPPGAPSPGEH